MSVLMVLPDSFLSSEVGSLMFPDTGAPYVGTMPLVMAGMWTIALMPVVLVGVVVADWRSIVAGAVAGIAGYVILPELVLSAAAFVVVATAGRIPRSATVALTVLLPFTYLGMLATAYQFLG